MFIDARSITDGGSIATDVCIVGGGACGIALALEFIDAPFNVTLLESGDLKFKHRTQWLYKGENVGHNYFPLEFTRNRYFGGSTNNWYGRCRPLDSIDFDKRDWVPYSGWPFTRKDLDPYYARAHQVCELEEYNYDPENWETEDKTSFSLNRTPLETKVFHHSPPTKFGQTYREKIKKAANITTYLNANVVAIDLDEAGKEVEQLKVATLRKSKFTVQAKHYILAASGIENTRLLLVSNKVNPKGIGNTYDQVGRYFMEHLHIFGGFFVEAPHKLPANFYTVSNYGMVESNLGVGGAIGLKEAEMREKSLLNACSFFVMRPTYKNKDDYYTKAGLAMQKTVNIITHTTSPSLDIFRHFLTALRNTSNTTNLIKYRLKHWVKPRLQIALHTQSECVPNPNSRITLSVKKDALGVNRTKLDWRPENQDLKSLNRYFQILNDSLNKIGVPFQLVNHEVDENQWPLSLEGGKHYMGTTRIHEDERRGVVDQNCQVHGVSNLFISGASVFPTSGQANPTLTIVALSIRIADYIKQRMQAGNR